MKLDSIKTIGGHRRIPDREVKRLLGEKNKKEQSNKVAIYCRVSERLLKYARDKNYEVIEVFKSLWIKREKKKVAQVAATYKGTKNK